MSDNLPTSAESQPEPDLSGRKLGQFQLLRRLGRGGMAEVYLAEQASLHRKVAFKVLKSSLASDESYVTRFTNEARAAAALVHANIVQIHEVGCIEGVHFIAQEYVRGQNLRQYLDRHGPLSPSMAISVMRQVAAALHRAGQQRIIHRDIKPENIMLAASGEVKVADFGLARVSSDGRGVDVTQIGVTMGTPLYMSPEQVEGARVDPRSDLYSFGVTCYHMLAGRPPFEGETALSIALQHVRNKPQPLTELCNSAAEPLCRIVHKLLAKKPGDRYANAAELLRELREVNIEGREDEWAAGFSDWSEADDLSIADSRIEATQQLDELMKSAAAFRRPAWRTGIVALAAALAFMGGGAAAWLTRPQPFLQADAGSAPVVQRMPSVDRQYWQAIELGTEDGWRAVMDYFPPDQGPESDRPERLYYTRRAKQQLAYLFLEAGDYDRALALYTELANVESTEVQFRAIGLAGQANVLSRRTDPTTAQTALVPLVDLINELSDEARRDELANLAEQQLDPELKIPFNQFLELRTGRSGADRETDSG